MERLKRMGVVTPRGMPPAWTVRKDPSWTEEEEALDFGQTLQRVRANDPGLNAVTCHEVHSPSLKHCRESSMRRVCFMRQRSPATRQKCAAAA